MTIEQVGFNVARLCAQVEKTLLYKAEEKGLALIIDSRPAACPTWCSATRTASPRFC